MQRARVVKSELIEQDKIFYSIYIETKNANQLFLSETQDSLGTLAISIPQPENLIGTPLSSILLGDRNIMIARILAESLAKKTKRISLVSVFTKTINEKDAAPIMHKLMEKTIKEENDTSEV